MSLGKHPYVGDLDKSRNHASRHENGGVDEISVADLSGLLADDQNPVVHGVAKHTDVNRFLFVPALQYTGTFYGALGVWHSILLANNVVRTTVVTFRVPPEFVSLIHVHWVMRSPVTGNIYRNIDKRHAANGELISSNSQTTGYGTEALVANILTELADISALFAGIDSNDYIGCALTRDATNAADTCEDDVYIFGLLFEYVAGQ